MAASKRRQSLSGYPILFGNHISLAGLFSPKRCSDSGIRGIISIGCLQAAALMRLNATCLEILKMPGGSGFNDQPVSSKLKLPIGRLLAL